MHAEFGDRQALCAGSGGRSSGQRVGLNVGKLHISAKGEVMVRGEIGWGETPY